MRSTTKLMKNWQFTGPDGKTAAVDLPHTWNNIDGQDGGNDYWRGTCIYKTRFAAPTFDKNTQQVWLQFEGVNASAKVTLNGWRSPATTAATPPFARMSRLCWPTAMS